MRTTNFAHRVGARLRRVGVTSVSLAAISAIVLALPATAQQLRHDLPVVSETPDGQVLADGLVFDSWDEYVASDFFKVNGLRCGTRIDPNEGGIAGGSASDCSLNSTNPSGVYDPSIVKYRIPVVVHVIQTSSGTGFISESRVQSQIDVLNEDFLALPGTNGAPGTDIQIEFYLATEDPSGNPTNGITYSTNNTWFNDSGSYWNSLAWDPDRYLNIYTNSASGALGYVPFLPQNGGVGSNADRVVILHSTFGRNAPLPPYHLGRTTTHEVGHYLGLWHTFDNGCGSTSACYTSGDRICDTNRESNPVFGCPGSSSSCSSPDPFHNYLDYSDDICMNNFTPEQALRMRCTLEHWRSDLYEIDTGGGTPVEAPLDGYNITQGTELDGSLAHLVDSDDVKLHLASEVIATNKHATEVTITGLSPHTTVSQLDLTVETRTNRTKVVTKVFLHDRDANTWVQLDKFVQPRTDTVTTFTDIANPNAYVRDSDGKIRVRLFGRRGAVNPFEYFVDHVEFTVTP